MTIATRLRRALCRHDWLPVTKSWTAENWPDAKCRKCGVMRRVEP